MPTVNVDAIDIVEAMVVRLEAHDARFDEELRVSPQHRDATACVPTTPAVPVVFTRNEERDVVQVRVVEDEWIVTIDDRDTVAVDDRDAVKRARVADTMRQVVTYVVYVKPPMP